MRERYATPPAPCGGDGDGDGGDYGGDYDDSDLSQDFFVTSFELNEQ